MAVALAALGLGCGAGPGAIAGCEPADGVTPVCGFSNPEDFALAPGGAWLIVSQFPPPSGGVGSLVAFRIAGAERRTLFPDGAHVPAADADPSCPGPPDAALFAPHGVDLSTSYGVPPRLLVVNHGGREAIELFEVGWSEGGPALWWRGCVPLPEGAQGNDVAALPGGGFVVSNMMPRVEGVAALPTLARMAFGRDTGSVLEWTPGAGWRELPDSHGSAPNGVAASPDGSEVYFGEWAGSRLVRVRREGDPERRSVDLPHHPDNLSWTSDGQILVAGQEGGLGDVFGCVSLEGGTCALPFSVVAVDPVTLDVRNVLRHDGRAMGAASAALALGDEIWLGTFAGDRIARAPLVSP
jgi:hypothetical protein